MALTKWQPPTLRLHDDDGRVAWMELYFDLIYVAALIQLGDRLSADVSWDGVISFGAVFTVLWWTWTGTTAFMNRFAVDDVVHRVLIFLQMFAVGNLALVAVSPIDDRSTWLAVAYVAARLPLMAMYYRSRRIPGAEALVSALLMAFAVGAGLWLVSLAVEPPLRHWIWVVALLLELAAPIVLLRKTNAPPLHEHHLRERYALFTIIVLGETFVKVLSELASIGISTTTQILGGVGFLISIALWWTYFDDVAESSIRRTGRHNVVTWVYAHLPLTMALTAFGVASKKVVTVESLTGPVKPSYLWLLSGAIALALVATAALDRVTTSPHFAVGAGLRVLPRLVAAVVVLAVPIVVGTSNAVLALGVLAGVVMAQIAVEVLVASKIERRVIGGMHQQLDELAGTCHHLDGVPIVEPDTAGCERCDEMGQTWVQLRVCLVCGHVGCCDDTKGAHARLHFEQTGHALIASIEPGATWAYCYLDDLVDADWRTSAPRADADSAGPGGSGRASEHES